MNPSPTPDRRLNPAPSPQSSAKKVLMVEGNAGVRDGTAAALRGEGYAVTPAPDGREPLALLRGGFRPDLVLLDMSALLSDGRRFTELLRQEGQHAAVPIVVVVASALGRDWAAAMGCAGLVSKPVEPAAMLTEIRRCLG
jgi:two-component system, chemotaxis family, chemotaxis protein CheY